MQFIGTIEAKSDTKGRAFLPAVFRKAVVAEGAESWVLKRDMFQSCLVLYPIETWQKEVESLKSKLKHWNAQHQMLLRQFMSDVELVTLDGNGRFLIPKRYLQIASIDGNIVFLGMDDKIEIWSSAKFGTPFLSPEDVAIQISKLIDE